MSFRNYQRFCFLATNLAKDLHCQIKYQYLDQNGLATCNYPHQVTNWWLQFLWTSIFPRIPQLLTTSIGSNLVVRNLMQVTLSHTLSYLRQLCLQVHQWELGFQLYLQWGVFGRFSGSNTLFFKDFQRPLLCEGEFYPSTIFQLELRQLFYGQSF